MPAVTLVVLVVDQNSCLREAMLECVQRAGLHAEGFSSGAEFLAQPSRRS